MFGYSTKKDKSLNGEVGHIGPTPIALKGNVVSASPYEIRLAKISNIKGAIINPHASYV